MAIRHYGAYTTDASRDMGRFCWWWVYLCALSQFVLDYMVAIGWAIEPLRILTTKEHLLELLLYS